MSSAGCNANLSPEWVSAKPYKQTRNWRMMAIVAIVIGVLLAAALVTVSVLLSQQPKIPIWLEQKSVIRAVVTDANDTLTRAQSFTQPAATYTDTASNSTVNASYVSDKTETTSIILSHSDSQVKVLVLPGTLQVNDDATTDENDETDTSDLDEVIPMVIVTANPKTGDVASVQASITAANTTDFVNTAMLVAQQLLVDTKVIQSADDQNTKRNTLASDEQDCSLLTSFGSTKYCKSAQHDDQETEHEVYRKQYSNAALVNSRRKRNAGATQTNGADDHEVNVQVESYVSKDTGLLERGVVSASAKLTVFEDSSGTKIANLERKFTTTFEVVPSGVDNEFFEKLQRLVSETELVDVNEAKAQKPDAASPNGATNSSNFGARNAAHRSYDHEVARVFGQPVRIVSSASVGYCAFSANVRLYVGSYNYHAGATSSFCYSGEGEWNNVWRGQVSSQSGLLAIVSTPVGWVNVHGTVRFEALAEKRGSFSAQSITGSFESRGNIRVDGSGGWNSGTAETGASVNFQMNYQLPMTITMDLATCATKSRAVLHRSNSGRQSLYYKTSREVRRCRGKWIFKRCWNEREWSGQNYIPQSSLDGSASFTIWSI